MGISSHAVVVFSLGKNLLFKSILGRCAQLMGYQGWDEILMISLISSRRVGGYKIMKNTVIYGQKNTLFQFSELHFQK